MAKVKVYQSVCTILRTGEVVVSRHKRTFEDIRAMRDPRHEPLMETGEEVDETDLDERGRFHSADTE